MLCPFFKDGCFNEIINKIIFKSNQNQRTEQIEKKYKNTDREKITDRKPKLQTKIQR